MNLGLSADEFWDMTFLNYLRLVIHQAKKEANEWERTRVTLRVMKVYIKSLI